jgi:hypothetical protein
MLASGSGGEDGTEKFDNQKKGGPLATYYLYIILYIFLSI